MPYLLPIAWLQICALTSLCTPTIDIMEKFDEATQKELATFLEREQGKARLQQQIHNFTSMCWDKCITGSVSTRFSRSEEGCIANCVERFLDTSIFMVKQIENQRAALPHSS